MKKTILAVATSALFAASAQAASVYDSEDVSVDVYGRAQFDIRDEGDDTDGNGSARLGVKAKSKISEGFYGVAKLEWQVAAENRDTGTSCEVDTDDDDNDGLTTDLVCETDTSSQFTARHAYAGFQSDSWGTVVFGQTDTAFYATVAPTDIYNSFGYAAFNLIEVGRQEGQIIYTGEFGGFSVGATYQFRDSDYSYEIGSPNGAPDATIAVGALDNSYAANIGYAFDFGLALNGGYHKEDFEDGTSKDNYGLSAAYNLDALYLAAVYVNADYEGAELEGYDFVASYNLGQTDVYGGYTYQEAKGDISNIGDTADLFTLGVSYKFNSNIKVWAEYEANQLSGADDRWDISVQYNF